jgi:hypothetical protein
VGAVPLRMRMRIVSLRKGLEGAMDRSLWREELEALCQPGVFYFMDSPLRLSRND